MPEFLELISPNKALDKFLDRIVPLSGTEKIATEDSLQRITGSAILAPHSLPTFPRSTVDGYAVVAADTFGVSPTLPGYLNIVGEIAMGEIPRFRIGSGECALIHTGGMLPMGANAIIMLEESQVIDLKELEIYRPVAVGENVIKVGEDVLAGEIVVEKGKRLRAADIGGLLALGLTEIDVISLPKVGIISTGDEVVPPNSVPKAGQVRDINSYTLYALIQNSGGNPVRYGIAPDDYEHLIEATRISHSQCDLTVVTAGSSASARDLTYKVFNQIGDPGVIVHGVSIRPGKPTILAICNGKPMIGLPGNPVSALVVASIFVTSAINKLAGLSAEPIKPTITAKMLINIPSQAGREDWVPVKIYGESLSALPEYTAEPIFGKSNLIFTLSHADGLVKIPADLTGVAAGDNVVVYLL